jgi:hypothetical protein
MEEEGGAGDKVPPSSGSGGSQRLLSCPGNALQKGVWDAAEGGYTKVDKLVGCSAEACGCGTEGV